MLLRQWTPIILKRRLYWLQYGLHREQDRVLRWLFPSIALQPYHLCPADDSKAGGNLSVTRLLQRGDQWPSTYRQIIHEQHWNDGRIVCQLLSGLGSNVCRSGICTTMLLRFFAAQHGCRGGCKQMQHALYRQFEGVLRQQLSIERLQGHPILCQLSRNA